jgi:hypothetical protein
MGARQLFQVGSVVFNAKVGMVDGSINGQVVSRTKTVRAAVRTLIKTYGIAKIQCGEPFKIAVRKAQKEFL